MINTMMNACLFFGVFIMDLQCSYRPLCIGLAINGSSNTPWSITTLEVHDKDTTEKALIHYLLFTNLSFSHLCTFSWKIQIIYVWPADSNQNVIMTSKINLN